MINMNLAYKPRTPFRGMVQTLSLLIVVVMSTMIVVSLTMSERNLFPKRLFTNRVYNSRFVKHVERSERLQSQPEHQAANATVVNDFKILGSVADETKVPADSGDDGTMGAKSNLNYISGERHKKYGDDQPPADTIENTSISSRESLPYYKSLEYVRRDDKKPSSTQPLRFRTFANVTKNIASADIPLHALSSSKPYSERMRGIQDRCKNNPVGDFANVIDLKRFVADVKHESIMCVVPKNACTTWKSIILYMLGKVSLEEAFHTKTKFLVIDDGKIKSIARRPLPAATEVFNKYTKFMVTRHPFQRLVSAFRSKFVKWNPSYRFSRGRRIAKYALEDKLNQTLTINFSRNKKAQTMEVITNLPQFKMSSEAKKAEILDLARRTYHGNITFEEFLRYGIALNGTEEQSRGLDVHWRPQHMLCNPCAINFDFVIRFENLGKESNLILDHIQRKDPENTRIKFPEKGSATVTDDVTRNYFDKIPEDLKNTIRKIYKYDFYYFDYDPNLY